MIEFIAAVYNEEKEIEDLVRHVAPYVSGFNIVDDGSTDHTVELLSWPNFMRLQVEKRWYIKSIPHTGLPETAKSEALQLVKDGSWVIMLDADERFVDGVLAAIVAFCNSAEAEEVDYVYFRQVELIDDKPVREFQKCKLFRKEAMSFPLHNIHADDVLTGRGITREDWIVWHRKSTDKQVTREMEYLSTYKKLLADGDIDEGRYNWLVGLHHYVKPH